MVFLAMDLDPEACRRALSLRDSRFDGRFFTGVKTTGVYCRPVCPAPTPKAGNAVFFLTAAAAQEAGFRPCLRCRPETAPDMGAWRSTSNTVSRALALISAGALDQANVEALAARLGMGERQLRRLFRQHLGASPVAVAQTQRILLAKQLLHETPLSLAEIAFASGFGSIRRFNEIFKTLFGRLLLRYQPPYDWPDSSRWRNGRTVASRTWCVDRHGESQCLGGFEGRARENPSRLAASKHQAASGSRIYVRSCDRRTEAVKSVAIGRGPYASTHESWCKSLKWNHNLLLFRNPIGAEPRPLRLVENDYLSIFCVIAIEDRSSMPVHTPPPLIFSRGRGNYYFTREGAARIILS